MWTFDNFPKAAVKQKYGVAIDDAWLGRLQRSIARLEGGCTGSFVSPDGLVLTNHHCAVELRRRAVQRQRRTSSRTASTPAAAPASASARARLVSVLVGIEDITAKVNAATAGLRGRQGQRGAQADAEPPRIRLHGCAARARAGALACESVTLYQGGQYFLYKYKRYDDVRLVFAPEQSIAAFGGDPDNFNFPRWCLDFSLMRVYENGKPARTPDYLQLARRRAARGRAGLRRPAIPAAPAACSPSSS